MVNPIQFSELSLGQIAIALCMVSLALGFVLGIISTHLSKKDKVYILPEQDQQKLYDLPPVSNGYVNRK